MFRPLGIGEIFDRAITIYTRNFAVFTLMVLTLFVPFTVVQVFATPDRSQSISRAIDQIEHPTATNASKKAADPLAGYTPAKITMLLVAFALLLTFAPFVNNAVAVGVAAVYFGKRPDYRSSFGTVMRRWGAVLGASWLAMLLMMIAYAVCIAAVILIFAIGALLFKQVAPLAVLLMIVGAVLFLGVIVLLMVFALCYAFALYSVSLEGAGPRSALASALSRIFNKAEFGKAVLMGLAYIGIEMGVVTISSTVGLLLLFVFRSSTAQLAVNAVISSILTAFVAILLAVYYYDVRTRREGLDLEADLQRLTA